MAFIFAEESASSAEMDAFLIVKKERKRMKKEGQVRIPSGCAISAVISRKGERMSGEGIMKSMVPMHERSNYRRTEVLIYGGDSPLSGPDRHPRQ